MSVSIFFCYAHEDEPFLKKLKAHLRPLQRQGLIDVWYDRDISAGTEWEQEIKKHLNEAKIILLLVSPDFMDSDYCYGIEMQRSLERHRRGEARVIPIILRPVYWQGILGTLQALPTDAKPVRSWSDVDEAPFDVTEGIRKVIVQLSQKPVSPSEESLSQASKQESADGSLTTLPPQPGKPLLSLKPEAVSSEAIPSQVSKGESADVSHLVLMAPPGKPLLSLKPEVMNYLDFELEIGAGSGREYPIVVLHSAGGEARAIMHFPFDELALESQVKDLQIALLRSGGKRRQILSPEEQTVQNFGRALFNALFTGEVRSRYEVSRERAEHQGKGLRLKLRINAPEMAALPWEFLYDANEAEYVCLSSNTPIVRYIELPRPPQPLAVTLPLRILGMTASPQDLPELDVEREKQRVEIALKDVRTTGAIELTWLEGQSAYDLQRAMRGGPWHIFHFIGHGGFNARTDEGLLALVDEAGRADYVSATHLGRLLADHRSLKLVVLNSCEGAKGSKRDIFSSTAAILVRRGIPAVLAMQYEITDRAAITLSKVFYEALTDGTPVDMAVSEARKTICLAAGTTVEWGTPVLYMRSPDGVLFDLIKKPSLPQEQPLAIEKLLTRNEAEGIRKVVEQLGTKPVSPPEVLLSQASKQESADVSLTALSPQPAKPASMDKSDEFTLIRTFEGNSGVVWSVALEAKGTMLASGNDDTTIDIWDIDRNELGDTLMGYTKGINETPIVEFGEIDISQLDDTFRGHKEAVNCVAFSPNENLLVSGSDDNTIKVWKPYTSPPLKHTLEGHKGAVNCIAFSLDGQTIVSGSEDRRIKLWYTRTGHLRRTLLGHSGGVNSVAISADEQIISGSNDKTIKVWDLEVGNLLRTLEGHSEGVNSVAISSDGKILVSGSVDKTIKLWNPHTGSLLRTLEGHSEGVNSVAISADGLILASSDDKTIKLWNSETGQLTFTINEISGGINSIAFNTNRFMLAYSIGETIKIWRKK